MLSSQASPASLAEVLRLKLHVLVVEDEQRYRNFLLDVLRDMDCQPTGAATAMEALTLIESRMPDVVLLDLRLPVMDGMTFLGRFRQRHPEVPVIILTGVGDLQSAQQAIRFGVTDFLTKPCHLGQIDAALDRARRQLAATADATQAEPNATSPAISHDAMRSIEAIEREAILEALNRHRHNRSAAAVELGISRRTLYNRIDQYRREGHLSS